jgi:alkylated DNA repair protein (DNA oxidative demethylase)
MTAIPGGASGDLLSGTARGSELLAEGAILLHGFARAGAARLLEGVRGITEAAPFRHMLTPGDHRMSVAMTSCGAVGWVADRGGYSYARLDPETGRPWPAMPECFLALAVLAAAECGYPRFEPDACLVNEYRPGTRLSLHQDADELDFTQPIVSVSLGLPATFLFGGAHRGDKPRRVRLESGDVVVWGGPARLFFHGVAPLADGFDPLTEDRRINLTFRRAR